MKLNSKILLIGGSGFLGNEIGIELVNAGYQINLLTREIKEDGCLSYPATQFCWESDGSVPESAIKGVDAIVNLSGESISAGRWTAAKKRRIVESRINTTRSVVQAAKNHRIDTLIQTSAIGYYGDTGSSIADESTPMGRGFLAETASQWEQQLKTLGNTRLVTMRLGVVLGTSGGALPEILNPYALGFGGKIGNGKHFLSWIHVKDVCRFVIHAMENKEVTGIYNLTAPNPVSYEKLHEFFVSKFGGPRWLKIPSQIFKLVLGEKSQLLLMSQNVIPQNLVEIGFKFEFLNLEKCLEDLLGSDNSDCFILDHKQWIPASTHQVWDFFSSEKNLEKLTPAFLKFRVDSMSTASIEENSLISYRLKIHGLPVKWRSKIINYDPENSFQDIQLSGPYRTWNHTHRFMELGEGTLIQDFVKYKIPLGAIGGLFANTFVKNDIEKIFQYRRKKVSDIFSKKEDHDEK